MIAKSNWAMSVGFNATDSKLKIFESSALPEVVDAAYYPKNNLADSIPKPNPFCPFGSATKVILN